MAGYPFLYHNFRCSVDDSKRIRDRMITNRNDRRKPTIGPRTSSFQPHPKPLAPPGPLRFADAANVDISDLLTRYYPEGPSEGGMFEPRQRIRDRMITNRNERREPTIGPRTSSFQPYPMPFAPPDPPRLAQAANGGTSDLLTRYYPEGPSEGGMFEPRQGIRGPMITNRNERREPTIGPHPSSFQPHPMPLAPPDPPRLAQAANGGTSDLLTRYYPEGPSQGGMFEPRQGIRGPMITNRNERREPTIGPPPSSFQPNPMPLAPPDPPRLAQAANSDTSDLLTRYYPEGPSEGGMFEPRQGIRGPMITNRNERREPTIGPHPSSFQPHPMPLAPPGPLRFADAANVDISDLLTRYYPEGPSECGMFEPRQQISGPMNTIRNEEREPTIGPPPSSFQPNPMPLAPPDPPRLAQAANSDTSDLLTRYYPEGPSEGGMFEPRQGIRGPMITNRNERREPTIGPHPSSFQQHPMPLAPPGPLRFADAANVDISDLLTRYYPEGPSEGGMFEPRQGIRGPMITIRNEQLQATSEFNVDGVPRAYERSFQSKLTQFRQLCRRNAVPTVNNMTLNRQTLFQDSYRQIMLLSGYQLRQHLNIKFLGEEGFDCGGLSREWFFLLSQEILNPIYGLFEYSNNKDYCLQINPASHIDPENLNNFNFFGKFIAMALYHGHSIHSGFTMPFYKRMLNKKLTMEDMKSIDVEFYNSVVWIKDNNMDEGGLELYFCADFEILGQVIHQELKENGDKIKVVEKNKEEYIRLMIEYRMNRGIEQQTKAFLDGFYEVVPLEWLKYFNETELDLILCGRKEIDVDDWEQNSNYSGYTKDSKQIRWFWHFVRTSDSEKRARLLQFVTGSCRVPVGGFAELGGKFSIENLRDANLLPISFTCVNQLFLPAYNSYDQLVKKLNYAIEETEGFSKS